jgi:5'-nucleotidase
MPVKEASPMDISRIERSTLPQAPASRREEKNEPLPSSQPDSVHISSPGTPAQTPLPITIEGGGAKIQKKIKGTVTEKELVLEIKHTNDVHGNMTSVATFIKSDDFWVDAGDAWQDYSFNSVLAGGHREVEIMNRRDCDLATTGNHFYDDRGTEGSAELMGSSNFPYLSANTKGMLPYMIADVEGTKIAFIGVRTPQKKFLMVDPSLVKDLELTDPIEAVRRSVEEVKAQGVKNIVVLSHLGLQQSPEFHDNTPTDRDLAAQVPGIDLIIGGHSHTPTFEKVEVNGTRIVQAGISAHSDVKTDDLLLGELKLTIDRGSQRIISIGHRLIPIDRNITPDEDVRAIAEKYGQNEKEVLARKLGTSALELSHELKTTADSTLGNLITDAMRNATGADVALLDSNFFSNRKNTDATLLPKGEISMKELVALSPWMGTSLDTRLETWDMKGEDIRKLLEDGVNKLRGPKKDQGLYQVSGLEMTYDPNKAEGKRVTDISIGGKPFEPDKAYKLTTTYTIGNWNPILSGRDENTVRDGERLRLVVADYLKQGGALTAATGGRIRRA